MKFIILVITLQIILINFTFFSQNSDFSECACEENINILDSSHTKKEILVSKEDEVFGDQSYGKRVKVSNFISFQKSVDVHEEYQELKHKCPLGWIPPTVEQYKEIINSTTLEQLQNELQYHAGIYYASFDAPEPYENDIDEQVFQSLYIDPYTKEVSIQPAQSWNLDVHTFKTKCIQLLPLEKNDIHEFVYGLKDQDFHQCQKSTISILPNKQVIGQNWKFSNGIELNNTQVNLIAQTQESNCGKFILDIQLFGGFNLTFCHNFYTVPYKSSESNTQDQLKDQQSIQKIQLDKNKGETVQQFQIFKSPGAAPIASKLQNGAYILRSQLETDYLQVLEVNNDGEIVQKINLEQQGYPIDIVSTEFGFVYLSTYENEDGKLLQVTAYNTEQHNIHWSTILINNGNHPDYTSELHQIDLEGAYGADIMFDPQTGRLSYQKDQIFVIFSHQNFFGYQDDEHKNRLDQQGDSTVFLSVETGEKTGQSFSWGIESSLQQSVLYDGKYLYTSAIGEQQIANYRIQFQSHNTFSEEFHSLVPQQIATDGQDNSCGRLGQLVKVNDNIFAQIWSQKPCELFDSVEGQKQGQNRNNNNITIDNRLSILFFDQEMKKLGEYKLKQGHQINAIKSVAYGDHILIAYAQLNKKTDAEFLDRFITAEDHDMHIILVNQKGQIVKDLKIDEFSISATDDWEILQDGSIVWTYVNRQNQLSLYKLPLLINNKEKQDPYQKQLQDNCELFSNYQYSDEYKRLQQDTLFQQDQKGDIQTTDKDKEQEKNKKNKDHKKKIDSLFIGLVACVSFLAITLIAGVTLRCIKNRKLQKYNKNAEIGNTNKEYTETVDYSIDGSPQKPKRVLEILDDNISPKKESPEKPKQDQQSELKNKFPLLRVEEAKEDIDSIQDLQLEESKDIVDLKIQQDEIKDSPHESPKNVEQKLQRIEQLKQDLKRKISNQLITSRGSVESPSRTEDNQQQTEPNNSSTNIAKEFFSPQRTEERKLSNFSPQKKRRGSRIVFKRQKSKAEN